MSEEEFKRQQKLKILEIEKEQRKLLNQSLRIAKLPAPKRISTVFTRAMKTFSLVMKAHSLQNNKRLILTQPFPKFPSGGIAYIKNDRQETVVNRKYEVLISDLPQMRFEGPAILPGEEMS